MKISIRLTFLFVVCAHTVFSQNVVFTASKEQDCNILKTTFNASKSDGAAPLTYYWNFGNGNTISGTDKAIVEVIYVEPGAPKVSLYVIDADGKKSTTATRDMHILAGPTLNFEVAPSITCSGKPVQFINSTKEGSSPITGYIWNIGNNISIRDISPAYAFGNTGTYDVTLIATDANGCNVSLKKEGIIKVENNFQALVQVDSVYSCNAPFTTRFYDVSNYWNVTGHSFSYAWDFGDGSTSNEKMPLKTYSTIGTFSTHFTLTDKTDGCKSTWAVSNHLLVGGKTPKTTIALQSRDCNSYIYSLNPNDNGLPSRFFRTIDLGDGTIHTLQGEDGFSYTYKQPGTYYLKTSFQDPNEVGCSRIGLDTLIVPTSKEEIVADTTHSCQLPFLVHFSTRNILDALYYEWDFGDGTTSKKPNPAKTYTKRGNFDVRLKVWSQSGCVYLLEKKAFVQTGKMNISFTTDAKRISQVPREFESHPTQDSTALWGGCFPFQVNFTNTSPPTGGMSYRWIFGDGTFQNSSATVAQHTYTKAGIYTPLLIAKDVNGCSDTTSCINCVRVGTPPKASIIPSGPDTVCCLYDKTFSSNIKLEDVDLLWYNIDLQDGFSTGLTQAYYRNKEGEWVLEDNTGTISAYEPKGQGLHYSQTNFAPATGNYPDLYFYAYKNGCATKVELPNYQKHILPWGTFSPLPCAEEEDLQGGDTLDFNRIGGNWILGLDQNGKDRKLSKAVVKFEFSGPNGCTMPAVEQSYTPASIGFEMTGTVFEKIRTAGLFPKIVLPTCAKKGDELLTTTYLYTHDDAKKSYNKEKCLCEEHWPYKLGGSANINYSASPKMGCSPLEVTFIGNASQQWIFEDGSIVQGKYSKKVFDKAGTYRFKAITNECTPNKWSDSVVVHGKPVAHFKPNQTLFCLNKDTVNTSSPALELTDSSYSLRDTIVKWEWNFGTGSSLVATTNSRVTYLYSEKDLQSAPSKTSFVRLAVSDNNGCKAQDSVKLILRGTQPVFNLTKKNGCYDTLSVIPVFPQMGTFSPFTGKLTIDYLSGSQSTRLYENSVSDFAANNYLLRYNGKYRVKMQIEQDALGTCSSYRDTLLNVLYEDLSPDFKMISKTRFSCVPAMVQTKDLSKVNGNTSIRSWDWQIVNYFSKAQVNGTGEFPSAFALTDSGYYYGSLSIVDQRGCQKTIYKDSVVYINELKGKIDSISPPLCPGETAYFKGSSNNASSYFWDFGDGTVSSGLIANHSYMSVGDRYVAFIVTDSSNCRKSYTGKLTMKPAPSFDLGKDTLLCAGTPIILQGPEQAKYAYLWSTSSTTSSLAVTQAGRYALTVWDTTLNCTYKDSVNVGVSTLPKVSIAPQIPICQGETIRLQAVTDSTTTRFVWKKADQVLGSQAYLDHLVQDKGPMTLEVFNKDNCLNKSSLTLPMLDKPVLSLKDRSICPGDSALFRPTVSATYPNFHFTWSYPQAQPMDTTPSLLAKSAGTYQVSYGKPNYTATASASLMFNPLPDPNLNPQFALLCEEMESVEIDGGQSYSLSWLPNGESQRFFQVAKVGIYVVQLTNQYQCKVNDSIIVENRCPPKLYVPTAFSPEQIGENQLFTVFGYNIGIFEMLIYSRWGELIYKTTDLHEPWNGYFKGDLMPSGVYPWIVTYSGNNHDYSAVQQMEGKVVLVR